MTPARRSGATIFLIGYMATGKTTLGTALQEAAEVEFIDLDGLVEHTCGMSVAELFATRGEDAFRRLEADAIARLCREAADSGRVRVVACGGGTPCHGDNLDRMLAAGTVIWLRADTGIVIDRLLDAPGQRPLVDGMSREELAEFIDRNLHERRPFYSRAHACFDTSRLDTPRQIADTTALFIRKFLTPQ